MKQEIFKKSVELQEKLSQAKTQLATLENYQNKPTQIRFGNNYNVSIPIDIDPLLYDMLINNAITDKHIIIKELTVEFENL